MQIAYLNKELTFTASRSSGKGGQHINKTDTRVELWFHIANSSLLSEEQKNILLAKLKNKINSRGYLHLSCQTTRSKQKNKELLIKKFYELLKRALKPVKKRKPSVPAKSAKEKRLSDKKNKSEIKQTRQKVRF